MSKNVLVRNIDKETLKKLKKKAAANNRSLQEELKELLEMHAGPDIEEVRQMVRENLEKYRKQGRKFSDSTKDISEDRER
ncbi:FitA-like ribbon-helix-helix domain-containing protein [Fodinibius sp. AD559]|uniref:FitA-like ribbon-helix-helix domain-containing protein n=1 Tax=Fodinibius sp. AD559 TaxID=3424179 RepID=UPI004046A2BF